MVPGAVVGSAVAFVVVEIVDVSFVVVAVLSLMVVSKKVREMVELFASVVHMKVDEFEVVV